MHYWKNKKVLITGGAGFIGSNLAERLVCEGARVKIIDNLERGKKEYLASIIDQIEFIHGDLRKKQDARTAMKNIEVVFHMASKVGGIGYYLSSPGEVIVQNSIIDTTTLTAALENNVEKYLYASSAHVYPIDLQMRPDSPKMLENQAIPAQPELSYGWAKLFGEKQIEYLIEEGNTNARFSVPRLIGAYGKNQDIELETASAIPAFCRRAIEYPKRKPFRIWGTGEETRSYCYIDDVVEGLMKSIEKLDSMTLIGPFNLGSEQRIKIKDIASLVIKTSGKPIKLEFDKSKETNIWGQVADCQYARELLDGWKPKVSFEKGIRTVYKHIEERL
ncbi:SDR family NAD(P)-dependent oxidoreductase [bacterium]|nr:SDR family NAD(P)-dependent oxidoreductase [bacterium]